MNKLTKLFTLNPSTLAGVIILAGLSLAPGSELSPEVREWKSQDGQYAVMASLSGFDRFTQRVTLNKEDATVVEVPLSRLSAADRTYVVDHTRGTATPPEKEKTLYGIRWQPEMEDALAKAAGEATPDDDRPVMWFRVLGELEQDL